MIIKYFVSPSTEKTFKSNPTLSFKKNKRQLWDRRFRRNSSLQGAWDIFNLFRDTGCVLVSQFFFEHFVSPNTEQYWHYFHSYTVEGRHIFRLTTIANTLGIHTRPRMQYSTALKKHVVNDLISRFSGFEGCLRWVRFIPSRRIQKKWQNRT